MNLRVVTLLVAIAATVSMAIGADVYGWHSTAGIWLLAANLPGTIVAVWVGTATRIDILFYVSCPLVNWAFYFYLVKAALALKHKLSN